MITTRKALLSIAFAATVAGALTGASLRGETKELDICAAAAWPMIPAACLEGGIGQDVRYVSADNHGHGSKMAARFEIAFQ